MKKTKNKLARSKKRADLTFYCVMMVFPLLQFVLMWVGVNFNSILLAFKEYDENLNFVWSLGNFEDVISGFFTDVVIQKSLATSALLWLLTTCINMPLSLLISFYFYKNYKGTRLFKTLLFVPSVVSNVVTITIFYYMVDRGYPLLMKALFNIETVGLLVDNRTQLAAVIFYNLFYGLAGGFLFYTSAMCGIDESISEAAQIDGANNWQEFWHITLPLIFPTVSVFLVTSVSGIFIGDYDLELAYDARFHVWGLASDLNKEYNYRDVYVSVSSISGVEFWLDAKFVKNPNQAIMDVYGDWSLLNGEIILGDPAKGENSLVTTYTSAGTFLILYGISPGLMDSIEIPAGTILWPDASCKSADPIRIANDIKLVRDEEDDWKIVAGAQMPEIEVPDTPGEDEKPDNGEQTPDNGEQTPEGGNNNGESSDSGYVTKVNLLTKKENGKPSDSASAQGSVLPIIGIVSVVLLVTAGAALLVLVGLKKKGAKPSQK